MKTAEELALEAKLTADMEKRHRDLAEQLSREQTEKAAKELAELNERLRLIEAVSKTLPNEFEIETFEQWEQLPAMKRELWAEKYLSRFHVICNEAKARAGRGF